MIKIIFEKIQEIINEMAGSQIRDKSYYGVLKAN